MRLTGDDDSLEALVTMLVTMMGRAGCGNQQQDSVDVPELASDLLCAILDILGEPHWRSMGGSVEAISAPNHVSASASWRNYILSCSRLQLLGGRKMAAQEHVSSRFCRGSWHVPVQWRQPAHVS